MVPRTKLEHELPSAGARGFFRRTLRLFLFGVLVSYCFTVFYYLLRWINPTPAVYAHSLGSEGFHSLLFYTGILTWMPLIGALAALFIGALYSGGVALVKKLRRGDSLNADRLDFIGLVVIAAVNGGVLALPHYSYAFRAPFSLVVLAGGLLIGAAAVFIARRWPRIELWAHRIAGGLLGLAVLLYLVLYLFGLGYQAYPPPPEESPGPNILVIVSDAHRADYCSLYDGPAPTPNLERLAERGVSFERCYAPCNWTLPSISSLFTGLEPAVHRVGLQKNLAPLVSLQELLAANGYTTWALHSNEVVNHRTGHYRRFDTYSNWSYLNIPTFGIQYNIMGYDGPLYLAFVQMAMHMLFDLDLQHIKAVANETAVELAGELPPEGGVYAYVHLFDPHYPFAPPPELIPDNDYHGPLQEYSGLHYVPLRLEGAKDETPLEERRQLRRLYQGEIRYADRVLGEMLDRLEAGGALENTVVFYTGDHGEALWEHEELGHATSLYDEQIHVPLVACWPGQFEGGDIRHDPVSLTDVYATILSGLGIDYNTEATLAQPLQEPVDPNRVIYAHNLGHYGAEGTVIAPRGRLIMDPLDDPAGYELYAADDYGQTADLAAERPELVAELLELWTAYLERCARITERFNPYATEDIEELSPAQIEQLRAIGYMQ